MWLKDFYICIIGSRILLAFAIGAALAAPRAEGASTNTPTIGSIGQAETNPTPAPTYLRDVLPILMGKCSRCHNPQTAILHNFLDYKTASADRWELKRRVWHSWMGSYFKQPMPMANSSESQAMTEEERKVIKDWVDAGAKYGVPPSPGSAKSKAERMQLGQRLFGIICSSCHQPSGQGIPEKFPPLAGSDFLNSDKNRAIKTVLHGRQGEIVVNGHAFNNVMPMLPLTDDEIAAALTYVYNSFGNSGKEVTAEEVKALRGEKPDADTAAKTPPTPSPFE